MNRIERVFAGVASRSSFLISLESSRVERDRRKKTSSPTITAPKSSKDLGQIGVRGLDDLARYLRGKKGRTRPANCCGNLP